MIAGMVAVDLRKRDINPSKPHQGFFYTFTLSIFIYKNYPQKAAGGFTCILSK